MEAKELMIGDWVNVLWGRFPRPTKVNKLEADGSVWVEPLTPDGSVAIQCDVFPIPLTTEILEKNGKKDEYARQYDVTQIWLTREENGEFPEVGIEFQNFKKKWQLESRSYSAIVNTDLQYVHELQHALRICGLNELADNFKI